MNTDTEIRSIVDKTARFIEKKRLMLPGDKVVVALSGGSDSVCLLHVLLALKYNVVAAHCNFHLRGEESMRDERFVRDLCANVGVELEVREFDTTAYATAGKISVEMAARELRYDFFEEMRVRFGAKVVAVAHHQDDCIETFLLNAVRGTGVKGLGGIKAHSGNVVRPLLCVSHAEILKELARIGQTYVDDSTNQENVYMRNKVRLDVMPILKQINPAASRNLMKTVENMQEVLKVYEAGIRRDIKKCTLIDGCSATIDRNLLMQCPSPSSVIHELLSPLGFNGCQQEQILVTEESGRTFLSVETDAEGRHFVALTDRDKIVVRPSDNVEFEEVPLTEFLGIKTIERKVDDVVILRDCHYAYVDADKVRHGLTVRRVSAGDRIRPFGMKGSKLVSDLLTDIKMNVLDKQKQLVVCDGQAVVWVVGIRSSEDYRVDENTQNVLELNLIL